MTENVSIGEVPIGHGPAPYCEVAVINKTVHIIPKALLGEHLIFTRSGTTHLIRLLQKSLDQDLIRHSGQWSPRP